MWGGGLSPLTAAPPLDSNQGGTQMEFTRNASEILVNAWALSSRGCGQVLTPEAYPDAIELADAGWLERRTRGRRPIDLVVDARKPKRRST